MNPIELPVTIISHPIRMSRPKVNVVYPQVGRLANPVAQSRINLEIVKSLGSIMQELGYGNDNLQEMTGYFEIKTNERGVLSLLLSVYSFTGGAHGLTIAKGLTFDVHTGRLYRLDELFKPGSDYRERLSEEIARLIKDWDIDLLEPFECITDDQDFYIADHSLTVFFQLYELTAYVYGFLYFPVPLKDLEPAIENNSLLSRLLPF